jgi:hypothetical protein
MFWFWLNMPLAAACFLAWCGIPLRMVLKHASWGPEPADSHAAAEPACGGAPLSLPRQRSARNAAIAAVSSGAAKALP